MREIHNLTRVHPNVWRNHVMFTRRITQHMRRYWKRRPLKKAHLILERYAESLAEDLA